MVLIPVLVRSLWFIKPNGASMIPIPPPPIFFTLHEGVLNFSEFTTCYNKLKTKCEEADSVRLREAEEEEVQFDCVCV